MSLISYPKIRPIVHIEIENYLQEKEHEVIITEKFSVANCRFMLENGDVIFGKWNLIIEKYFILTLVFRFRRCLQIKKVERYQIVKLYLENLLHFFPTITIFPWSHYCKIRNIKTIRIKNMM